MVQDKRNTMDPAATDTDSSAQMDPAMNNQDFSEAGSAPDELTDAALKDTDEDDV